MALEKVWFYFLSIGALIGTIIGVGMFGLPFVAAKAGVVTALFYLLVFGIITGLVHLLYFEVALHTSHKHRLTGYVGLYLGRRWKTVTFVQGLISLWGTLLVYTIIGAKFLNIIIGEVISQYSSHQETILGTLFFVISALIVAKGSYTVGKQEFFFSVPLIVIIIILFFRALSSPSFSLQGLVAVDSSYWILPYGVTLFSLAGFSVIPTIKIILEQGEQKGHRFHFPLIIMLGTLIPAFLYMLFVIAVIGISGKATTADALSGLEQFLGKGIISLGALLGVLAIYTSFISIGDELKNTFINDYKMPSFPANLFTFSVPLLFYLFDVRDFVLLANFVGAIMGGYVGVIVVLLFWEIVKKREVNPPFSGSFLRAVGWFIIIIFVFASLYALLDTVKHLW